MDTKIAAPILFPYAPEEFWEKVRAIVKEELGKTKNEKTGNELFRTSGLTYKPLYKIEDVCGIFRVTRPTIYDWIKHGKLKPYKVRSRLYFLHNDIQSMLGNTNAESLNS